MFLKFDLDLLNNNFEYNINSIKFYNNRIIRKIIFIFL